MNSRFATASFEEAFGVAKRASCIFIVFILNTIVNMQFTFIVPAYLRFLALLIPHFLRNCLFNRVNFFGLLAQVEEEHLILSSKKSQKKPVNCILHVTGSTHLHIGSLPWLKYYMKAE